MRRNEMKLERKLEIQQRIIARLQEEKEQLVKANKQLQQQLEISHAQLEDSVQEYQSLIASVKATQGTYKKKLRQLLELKRNYSKDLRQLMKTIKKGV